MLFADVFRDFRYRTDTIPPDVAIPGLERKTFERNVRIASLKDRSSRSYSIVHILFAAPEAVLTITKEDGTPITDDPLTIELRTSSESTRKIIVRANGQISIK